MDEKEISQAAMLPEDVLTEVLRRLAPRSLAASRCVCRAWRAAVDGNGLLRADLLPHSLAGIFVNFCELGLTEFFSCPTTTMEKISGNLRFTPNISVLDHCNGLLLLYRSVANPATRQWAPIPAKPSPRIGRKTFYQDPYLVFDPAVSPYYEIFLVPIVACWHDKLDYTLADTEWPPSLYESHVFSSRTGRWEERSFLREGEPVGSITDMQEAWTTEKRYGVYWRQALYAHCANNFIYKILVTSNTYQVIKPPVTTEPGRLQEPCLGRSENGVYYAAIDLQFRLRVWILDESSGEIRWVLRHQNNLQHMLSSPEFYQEDDGAWILENINYHEIFQGNETDEEPAEPKLRHHNWINLLGFHPFKEIVFLNSTLERGLAYDLKSAKVQDLGNMCPKYYNLFAGSHARILASFPYTPCWMENPLPTSSLKH
ncbi:hypothetical protein ACP4OV_020957 [Aristida adscensionis]